MNFSAKATKLSNLVFLCPIVQCHWCWMVKRNTAQLKSRLLSIGVIMAKQCQYELEGGRKATRVSDCDESDAEIIAALISRFGDQVISVKIEDRVIRIKNDGNS